MAHLWRARGLGRIRTHCGGRVSTEELERGERYNFPSLGLSLSVWAIPFLDLSILIGKINRGICDLWDSILCLTFRTFFIEEKFHRLIKMIFLFPKTSYHIEHRQLAVLTKRWKQMIYDLYSFSQWPWHLASYRKQKPETPSALPGLPRLLVQLDLIPIKFPKNL